MSWPRDFQKVRWGANGGLWTSGGEDYLVSFGPQKNPQLEESKDPPQQQQEMQEKESTEPKISHEEIRAILRKDGCSPQ